MMNEANANTAFNVNLKTEIESPYIVAIAAPAEGLDSLKKFFNLTSAIKDMAFVVITHLSPEHVSILVELLQKCTLMTVLPIINQQKILANHLYVLPPGKKASIHHGVFTLINQKKINELKLPINFFLASLAKDQGLKVICVILSGMGTDGTLGLRTIREKGGIVIAEKSTSAHYQAMPKSAINSDLVDYILPPEDMYEFILKYISHHEDKTLLTEQKTSEILQKILTYIKTQTGHDFSLYKTNTIFRRIQKRMDALQIHTLSEYGEYIQQIPLEITILFKELLINETNFFRDPSAFKVLKKNLLEKIFIHKSNNSGIRIWIPGCSTGEEVYSMAIIIYECIELLKISCRVQIFGTDVDEGAIVIAKAGVYSKSIKNNITPERLQRFFIKENSSYRINANIRKMIIFAVQNITKDPPFTHLDLISCRNLLIYLGSPLQKQLLSLFHYSLNPKGLLFLGASESLGTTAALFNIVDNKWNIFERIQRQNIDNSIVRLFYNNCSKINKKNNTNTISIGKIMNEVDPHLAQVVKNILLKHYTPSSVVIDENSSLIYIYGSTHQFLEFATGEVKFQLIDMVRPELKSKLQSSIRKSIEQEKEIVLNNQHIKIDGTFQSINIIIRPILEKIEYVKNKLLLIIFEKNVIEGVNDDTRVKKGSHKRNTQLEQELKFTKENLQTTIEELEIINEELKSSNEELQSTNEELQSTNEEIETSKEELQSLNDELTTVNTELENRIEQLSSANDDIKNFLDNTEIATLFLDKNLRIKRFTPKATDLINLIPTDVGRPVSDIASNLTYDQLVDDARKVLKTLEPITTEAVDKLKNWYVVRIIPFRTMSNLIDGIVITFLNIHDQEKIKHKMNSLEKDLSQMKDFNSLILNSLPSPALMLESDGKIIQANAVFSKKFKIQSERVKEQSVYDLKFEWDIHGLKKLIDEVLPDQLVIENYPLKISSKETTHITAHMIAFNSILLIMN